jgi:hypothetical protein
MITSPLAPYFCCKFDMEGNDALQGPHHEAQKSTSTTFPEVLGSAAPGNSPESFGIDAPTAG